jgi:hypothetical protein
MSFELQVCARRTCVCVTARDKCGNFKYGECGGIDLHVVWYYRQITDKLNEYLFISAVGMGICCLLYLHPYLYLMCWCFSKISFCCTLHMRLFRKLTSNHAHIFITENTNTIINLTISNNKKGRRVIMSCGTIQGAVCYLQSQFAGVCCMVRTSVTYSDNPGFDFGSEAGSPD